MFITDKSYEQAVIRYYAFHFFANKIWINTLKQYSDGIPIHIIKIKVVQVGERPLLVSFFCIYNFF